MSRTPLTNFAWLSIGTAIFTMALKALAYWLTGSVGLLSDAMESLVNLAGAIMALAMLAVSARPADEDHAYGHGKAEYFASGVEGALILIAAISIGVAAIDRLVTPKPLEQIGLGLIVSVLASLANLLVAMILLKAAKRYHSVSLEANAHHLLTDVWTSAGVLVGISLVAITGWQRLDPLAALGVAANIVWTGIHIMRKAALGLMDTALPEAELYLVHQVLAGHRQTGVEYHALRTRRAGTRRFVSLHVLVPGEWSVQQGHELLECIEADIRKALPNVTAFTHLEPLNDPCSWDDVALDRDETNRPPAA
jgi:cation diffusion facilitator family transporter